MRKSSYASDTIVVRSGGDIATGVVQKLCRSGFRVAILETPDPLTIRRSVALSSAVRERTCTVEEMTAVLTPDSQSCRAVWESGCIPVFVDPAMECLAKLRPAVLVDAIIAKRNTGMHKALAPITIALGPGFSAPENVDCVVETMRGHSLGKLITQGSALPNTGIPGILGGKSAERVVYSPVSGLVTHVCKLGDFVRRGEAIFYVDNVPVFARLDGILRGLIADGVVVRKGLKCADVDPRPADQVDYYSISDKARAIGGAVLEACFMLARQKNIFLQPVLKTETSPCMRFLPRKKRLAPGSHVLNLRKSAVQSLSI